MPSVLLPNHLHQPALQCCLTHAHTHVSDADLAILDALTAPSVQTAIINRYKRRDAPLDPLLFAAATLSGPHVTRHHYHHNFYLTDADVAPDGPAPAQFTDAKLRGTEKTPYVSAQAPRRERLLALGNRDVNKENQGAVAEAPTPNSLSTTVCTPSNGASGPHSKRRNVPSVLDFAQLAIAPSPYLAAPERALTLPAPSYSRGPMPVQVQCLVRTRIPTVHGEAFLHLYRNNRDTKEHLALVIDPAQLRSTDEAAPLYAPPIRSRTLDASWSQTEGEMDRIVRGAYHGRLGQPSPAGSVPPAATTRIEGGAPVPPPLIRIHSECFTGETVGSMRCDCGEQLYEAIRLISQPMSIDAPTGRTTVPGRGVVLYLRQEGRGIGLLSKLRAYNLQDLGFDTVAANLMLGYKADERRYEIAGAILRDLGLGDGVRLLTNNPDKIHALAAEGVKVAERVEMVPRAWKCDPDNDPSSAKGSHGAELRFGHPDGMAPRGEDLDRYLQTKVAKMGHLLHLPSAATSVQ